MNSTVGGKGDTFNNPKDAERVAKASATGATM
jgi:hypothetical protein